MKLLSRVWKLFATPCSLPGSSVHQIFQARVLECVAISFSRGSSWPRGRTRVSHIVGRCFTVWATSEVQSLFEQPCYLFLLWSHALRLYLPCGILRPHAEGKKLHFFIPPWLFLLLPEISTNGWGWPWEGRSHSRNLNIWLWFQLLTQIHSLQ